MGPRPPKHKKDSNLGKKKQPGQFISKQRFKKQFKGKSKPADKDFKGKKDKAALNENVKDVKSSASRPRKDSKFKPQKRGGPGDVKHATIKKNKQTKKEGITKEKGSNKEDLIKRMMGIYEDLRRADVPKKEKYTLIDEVLSMTNGKQAQVAFKHNSVRVIEMCVKYGTKEQRGKVWDVFSDLFEDTMMSKYGRFLIQKMLKYGTKNQRTLLVDKIKGKIMRLLKHKDAGRTVEDVYSQYADPSQKSRMVEEFYGPEFPILKASFGSDLGKVFTAAPDRKKFVLSFLKDALERLAQKEVVTYSIYHRAAAEYLKYAEASQREEFLEIMKEKVVNILHTEDGAKISIKCIWLSNAKDRKKITKSFKTYVPKICKEPYGHTVLMAMFDVIDDTVLVEKTIFTELISNLDELITDQYGRRVVLYVLAPRNTKYFAPPLINFLEEGDQNETSKKDKEQRSAELRQSLLPSVANYLKPRIPQAMKDNHLCQILIECVRNFTDNGDCKDLMEEVSRVVTEDFEPKGDAEEHVITHPCGHFVITKLLQQDKDRVKQGHSLLLSKVIVDELTESNLRNWIQVNRGAFVAARLVESGDDSVIQYVQRVVESCDLSVDETSNKGIQALMKALGNVGSAEMEE